MIHGSGSAENFDNVKCRTSSFPPAQISWEFRERGGSSYEPLIEDDHITINDIEDADPKRFYKTLDGALVIDEVEYDDAGTYRCSAFNPASGQTIEDSVLLRVRGMCPFGWWMGG